MNQTLEEKQKISVLGFTVFLALFILSMDLWEWGQPNSIDSLILGLPIWIYYLIFLTLATSVFFYIISKNIWRDEK